MTAAEELSRKRRPFSKSLAARSQLGQRGDPCGVVEHHLGAERSVRSPARAFPVGDLLKKGLSAEVGRRRQAPWREFIGRHRTERSKGRRSTPRKECSVGSRQPRKCGREHRDCTPTCTNAASVNRSGARRTPGCAGRWITMKNRARAWRELSERACCFQAVPPSNMKQSWLIFLDTTLSSAWLLASSYPRLYALLISFHCMCFNTVLLLPSLFGPTLSVKIQFNTNLSLGAIAWKCTKGTTTDY
ncbi:PREDICTED: putative transcriptional regulator encoded by LINC00473 [Mandrillus leucophaeus]|uniref:putative transcriptional regulator encoded by LINC00473 n=1 Tax=Mandrillus leucophaeus TaxID=9568 RepID=UPI0005F37AA1|nr:PREDICTED: putative transcriptional regulator encoded by LINC00473 [Mandrillus leucophaeus]